MSNTDDLMQYEYEYREEESSTAIDGGGHSAGVVQNNPAQNLSPRQSFEELRSSPRKKYEITQWVAPIYNRFLPSADEYINVECHDISRGGISFYLKRLPGCGHFAVALGQKPNTTILIARIMNMKEVRHKGKQMYLLGCQFVDRLQD